MLIPSVPWHKSSRDTEPHLSGEDIRRIVDAGVAGTVEYALSVSPFYRERFARTGLRPGAVRRAEQLQELPFTTKQDVARAERKLWCVEADQIVDFATTSGTTGTPTLYPITESDLRRLAHNEFLCFRRTGLSASDIVLLAVTMDKCFMAGLAYFEGLRRIGAATARVGAGSPAMLLSMIRRLRPTAIVSVPSFLSRVARYASQQGVDLRAASVRKLICIGEPLRSADFQLTPSAARLASDWNATVYSTYGITELAASFCECEAGQGGHLHPEILHFEIVDEQGHGVPDGQIGEVVATTIGVQGMPLIRFRTGDISFLDRRQCSCGLWTPRIGPILGRKNQMMKLKGTTVYPAAVQRTLDDMECVSDYVMIVTAPSALSDELEVVVAVRNHAPDATEQIRERLRGELKVAPTVRVASVEQVQALQDSRELRKNRVFVDRRTGPTGL
jgi:phenylacetate-CoA ligase